MSAKINLKPLIPTITTFFCFYTIGMFLLLKIGNYDFSLYLNPNHSYLADVFFKYITHLGDGLIAFLIVIILFFIRQDYGLLTLISLLTTTVITQFLKRIIFIDRFRPSNIFDELIKAGKWHVVEGVHLHDKFSFPSGHTATVFCIGILIAFLINSRVWSIFTVILISIVGFSRVYLSQHFLADILFGSLIGTLISFLVYYFLSIPMLKFSSKFSLHRRLNIKNGK